MTNVQEIADAISQEMRPNIRRKMLLELLDKIMSGELNSAEVPLNELFKLHTSPRMQIGGPRPQYIRPSERSSYDYGYMKTYEMEAGDPNIW